LRNLKLKKGYVLTLNEYYNDFMESINIKSNVNENFKESVFFENVLEFLEDEGVVTDYKYTPFKKIGMRVDGYEYVEDREILHLFVIEYTSNPDIITLTKTDLDSILARVVKFFVKNTEKPLFKELEETSEAYDISYFINTNKTKFKNIEIILLTNKQISKTLKKIPKVTLDRYDIKIDIWDIERFYQIETSKKHKEDFEINFHEEFDNALPALEAYNDSSSYKSYLSVVPGGILADLYEKYGARLLESNVRSFLQFRGKINKGIRKTIKTEPEMFFAYNNGITATAEDIEVKNAKIVYLKNFQIVNGGQTTASLYNTRKKDRISLEKVFVQMKLTIIKGDESQYVIPNISRYANTQNKVNDADFFSNDIFHIRIEEKSRKIWVPKKKDSLKATKWFYERARGQYLEEQSKLTDSQKKEFKLTYPKNQMFTKTDLAKYIMSTEEYPHIVSQGAQKNFLKFGELVVKQWNTNDKVFNDLYYKHAIAKAIMFKETDKLVYKQKWYAGYKANIVTYTLSLLTYLAKKLAKSIDYNKIWQNQDIDTVFIKEILKISKYVNSHLFETPENFKNISEWAKKELCWTKLKEKADNEKLMFSEEFTDKWIISSEEFKYEEKEAKKNQSIDNEIELLKKLFKFDMDKWKQLIEKGIKNNLVDKEEQILLNLIPNGKIPSKKQQKMLVSILNRMEDEGIQVW
jgi:DNA-binding TFAR19-related protein (PDSD5 family)